MYFNEVKTGCTGCCCCPNSISIGKPVNTGQWAEYKFSASGSVDYTIGLDFYNVPSPPGVQGFKPKGVGCSLWAYELPLRTNPAGGRGGIAPEGYTLGQWNDAVQKLSSDKFFDKWRALRAPDPCVKNGRVKTVFVTLTDNPKIASWWRSMFANFYTVIIVRGGRQCKCKVSVHSYNRG
jgi:hypothetical protein